MLQPPIAPLSLPISVLLILGILTAGNTFTNIDNILILGTTLFLIGILYPIFIRIKKSIVSKKSHNTSIIKENEVQFSADK